MSYTDSKNQKTKFCIYCGKEIQINAKRCNNCLKWLDDELSSNKPDPNTNNPKIEETSGNKAIQNSYPENKNHNTNPIANNSYYNIEEYSKAIPIRRFYLLILLTGGFYIYYWFYKNNSYLRDEFGKDISIGLRTFAFIFIPIANIIVFYELLNDMNSLIEEKGLESYSPGINTLILLFFPFIQMWVYINVQESFNEFWKTQEPHLPIRRDFDNGEVLIMILGMVVFFIVIILYIVLITYLYNPYYY